MNFKRQYNAKYQKRLEIHKKYLNVISNPNINKGLKYKAYIASKRSDLKKFNKIINLIESK